MFLIGLLISFLCFDALLLILMVMIQKGKSGMGLGALGGGTQMLFGGSGGQDLFQKITWVLTTIFMVGSLLLSIMWTRSVRYSSVETRPIPTQQMPAQPVENPYSE